MLATFPAPVLSVTADAVRDLEGRDALSGLWTLFTKCKESLQDGRRLENISWRLWYRELALAQHTYHPLTPDSMASSPAEEAKSRSPFFPPQSESSAAEHERQVSSRMYSSPVPYQAPSPTSTVSHLGDSRSPESPHRQASSPAKSQFGRPKSCSSVGRIIVDMLPNSAITPEKLSPPSARGSNASGESVHPYQRSHVQPLNLHSQHHPINQHSYPQVVVPSVQLPSTPSSADTSFPRVVVVNPTPHPTPPTTPVINHNPPQSSVNQQPSTHLLPPLPPPALRTIVQPTTATGPQLPAPPKEPSPPPVRPRPTDETLKPSDRRFFLQQSPEGESPERDGSTEGGKSLELFEASSGASSQMKGGVEARSTSRPRKGKEGSRHGPVRPTARRMHSSRHVPPVMQRKTSVAEGKHRATFNIGSASSNGSKGVTSTTTTTTSRILPPVKAPAAAVTNKVRAPSPAKAVQPGPQRRKIVVASTSSEYETTDETDEDEWASEEMDVEESAKQKEEIRLREAALEAQRQRDMFAKVPKRSYSNLGRTRSGLLSQLMNPNPEIFPPSHPYRTSHSTQDMTMLPRRASGVFPSMLTTSKSIAALPQAAQVTARAPLSNGSTHANGNENGNSGAGAYRPKGRPQEEDMEDESDSDEENDKIQISRSIAQQKLAALAGRRGSDRSTSSQNAHHSQMAATRPLPTVATAPIPLGHPYNLPAPAPPMTPRTTRRQMLSTELSESLRRNLLWERQVSKINVVVGARRPSGGLLGGLRPLTATASAGEPSSKVGERTSSNHGGEEDEKNERKRRAMARNRSWADDYHYAGW